MSRSRDRATRRDGVPRHHPPETEVRDKISSAVPEQPLERIRSLAELTGRAEVVLASLHDDSRVARLLRLALVRRDRILLERLLRPWLP